MTAIPFGPQLIGRTEKALNALLDRELAGFGVTEPQWVVLTLANVADGALAVDVLAARVSEALRVDEAAAHERVSELVAAELLRRFDNGASIEPTERGRSVWQQVRSATVVITEGLWGDLPGDDRAAAARVLNTVLMRAGAALTK